MQVSITELHNLTGQDRRRITKALANLDSKPGKKGAKLYESTDAIPLLYLAEEGSVLDPQKERARLTHHQANIAALEEKELEGELVRRSAVVAEVSEAIANCRAKLLSLPSKMASVVAGMSEVADIRGALQDNVHEALDELYTEYADISGSGEDVESTAEADS